MTELIAASEGMRRVMHLAERVGPTEAPVLLQGETGTGKSVLARHIHGLSKRSSRPFVVVDGTFCNEELWWANLFGHQKGAYTGADRQRQGLFGAGDSGTVLIEEVGELTLPLQRVLLRILDSGEFLPLGATKAVKTDVRIISATNRDLSAMVREGAFRADLLYRLKVFEILLPPLRERREDALAIIDRSLRLGANGHGVPKVSALAMNLLTRYPWPGNARELLNAMQRALILCDGEVLPEHLPREVFEAKRERPAINFEGLTLEEMTAAYIASVLGHFKGNKRAAAEALGINRQTLTRKLMAHKGDISAFSNLQ